MKISFTKVALITATIFAITSLANAQSPSSYDIQPVQEVNLNKYLGQWFEIARKPLYFQKMCDYNVSANYSLKSNGNIKVDNTCYDKDGKLKQSIGEAYVQNSPKNSILKVSFLPSLIRWIPVARGDYWILKLDENYQTVLVGSPNKKYLWVLSRNQNPDPKIVDEYLNYAQSLGYDLKDIIKTKQK